MNDDTASYIEEINKLHKDLVRGDIAEYHETQIALPRPLQGLRATQTMSRIAALNPNITTTDWTGVTAEVVGNNLTLAAVGAEGLRKLNSLKELTLEHGKSTTIPTASRPNNLYYVDLVLPHEVETHIELLGEFLKLFKTGSHMTNPGYKPFGSNRRLRLFFNSITAPREVFTADDPTIPLREVVLPNGIAAQIAHKWQRLNSFPPPHLAGRWLGRNGRKKSFAAAVGARINNGTIGNNEDQRQPQQIPETSPTPTITGSPHHAINTAQTVPPTPNPSQQEDINMGENPQTTGDTNENRPNISENGHGANTQTTPHRTTDETVDHPPQPQHTTNQPQPTREAAPQNEHGQHEQWNTIPIRGSRKPSPAPTTRTSQQNPTSNRFAMLATQPLDAFDDVTDFHPIAVSAQGDNNRAHYKATKTRKSRTNAMYTAMRHTQQIRHPHHTLRHLPPTRTQYILTTNDAETINGRKRLAFQIALLRWARKKDRKEKQWLAHVDDTKYLEDCSAILLDQGAAPTLPQDARIDQYLQQIMGDNQHEVRQAVITAKMDLYTRAFLPHLYDTSPRPSTWHGIHINWMESPDNTTACLDDKTLHNIGTNHTLNALWAHASNTSADVKRTIDYIRGITETQLTRH